ncbi:MAG: divergent polysaccharide deacetylase family protein [Pseudomonadota bacterium]
MDDLNKPLGVKGKKKTVAAGLIGKVLKFPFIAVSAGLVASLAFFAMIWVAVVDDPSGGRPQVDVRIVEPKFDNPDRDVAVIDVEPQNQNNDTELVLTELTPSEPGQLTEIDPNDVLIYDPSDVDQPVSGLTLSSVAEKELVEESRYGFLPRIGPNGEKALVAYSRPSGASDGGLNRVALVVGGLGIGRKTTREAIDGLPGEVSLAFAPYVNGLQEWMAKARALGHEILLQLPMEPFDYPNNDPGPKTLLVENTWPDNRDRLNWVLARITNYVGVVNFMGARFSASPEALKPLFEELRDRGLMYVDDGSTPLSRAGEVAKQTNLAFAQTTIVLDSILNADDIDARLLELESLARDKGLAIGVASAFPVTIERLQRWAKDADKRGIKLIPISATLDKSSF